jgi:hypothetical protein
MTAIQINSEGRNYTAIRPTGYLSGREKSWRIILKKLDESIYWER